MTVVVAVVMPRSRRLIRLRRQAWWRHPLQRIRRYTLSDESKAGIFVHGAVVVWTLAIGAQADPVVATITIGLGHIGVLVHGSRPVEICVHHASYGRRAVDRLCKRRILSYCQHELEYRLRAIIDTAPQADRACVWSRIFSEAGRGRGKQGDETVQGR